MKKKLEVVELNKKEEKILLEEKQSAFILFFKKYNKLILLILLLLSLIILITGIYVVFSNMPTSEKLIIKETSIYTDLDLGSDDVTANPMAPLTEKTAMNIFKNSATFKSDGEVLLVKTVSKNGYTIKFYSDFTAIKILKNNNTITKINSVNGNKYGITEDAVNDSDAKTIDISIVNTKKYSWGEVTYYSDGSASITNADIELYVRNAEDINDKYIANHKVSYLKEIVNNPGAKLNYFYDGTIEVIKNNTSYLVRNENDLDITNSDVIFKNNNESIIRETVKLDDGKKIDYYTDGGAIIIDGDKKLSVRNSNSIIIKDNKIYEIVDNIYVTISKTSNDGNIIYYTNGGAVIKDYNGKTLYIKENSDIKYKDGQISNIGSNYEELNNERNVKEDKVSTFETITIIENKEYIAIVPKDSILYDKDGSLKEIITDNINNDNKPITITNDTNEVIKYRLVIEKSNRTNLDTQYIRYQMSLNEKYIGPKKLNENIWTKDKISEGLTVQGTNYILIERTLQPLETDKIRLMLWTDYETIPNSMQDKYFYGTIRLYAWQEIKENI